MTSLHTPDWSHSDFVIDVISIASETRPEYPRGQADTWGRHASVRDFWAFAEGDDYDPECSSMGGEELRRKVEVCEGRSHGWEARAEEFASAYYGVVEGGAKRSDQRCVHSFSIFLCDCL